MLDGTSRRRLPIGIVVGACALVLATGSCDSETREVDGAPGPGREELSHLPDELDLPDGAEAVDARVEETNGRRTVTVDIRFDVRPQDAVRLLEDRLRSRGWDVEPPVRPGRDSRSVLAFQGYGWEGRAEIEETGDGSAATMVLSEQQS